MKIDITMQQTCSDNTISCQVARQVRFALSRFGTALQIIKVRITDINGPKGGIDTRCVVSVKLASAGEVVVQGDGENIFSALSYCLSRADRTISRSLARRRDAPIRINRRRLAEVKERDELEL
ncbi:MAG: HPF/RaiA family ribosome-associated protein [Desulfobulbaceae bacterium]|uniref:HPF/RaiA family ribosome-associated protein n=1 Tax=Candidatus Desulfobia pelagia TaxID=2841692 RepID=A0A8J6TBU1_9BACT|nr:HPF/RaiA family ribosome-associated protein [Candidatus Desulfobia pelagia]